MQKILLSDKFYEENIRNGYLLFENQTMKVTQNYIQKSDGTYRQAQLLSPVLMLVLESICKEIFNEVDDKLFNTHALYAGDFEENKVTYSKQYDLFFKEVNKLAGIYPYFMKFDISNFFKDIDLNMLFNIIEEKTNQFSQFYIYIYKQLFEFIGEGKFPIVENSSGLSYLATKIYLNEIDEKIITYFTKEKEVVLFEIIRYVDDLYVFIKPKDKNVKTDKLFSEFKNYYTTELRNLSLSLNANKSLIDESKDIKESLKESFYHGEIYDERINIHDIDFKYYEQFLDNLDKNLKENGTISIDDYNLIKNSSFDWPDIELSVEEIYNTIIYKFSNKFKNNEKIIKLLNSLVEDEVISFDVKRFVIAILHTKEKYLIKKLLNILFKKEEWNDSDNHIAITYLLQRNFKHEDLKFKLQENLVNRNEGLYTYSENYCDCILSWESPSNSDFLKECHRYSITTTTMHLYFLYLKAKSDNDALVSHAYFKTFFDRITAELAFSFNIDSKEDNKNPLYGKYYKKDNLIKIYKDFERGKKIIKEADKIRNASPIIHSSSELTKGSRTTEEIIGSITDLKFLINEFIKKHNLKFTAQNNMKS